MGHHDRRLLSLTSLAIGVLALAGYVTGWFAPSGVSSEEALVMITGT